ncbi:MAG: alpha-L-fucosidase [Eubacterium sp.]|nr:alpha-L-fucosidase [Eubacterium sp.]
MKLKLDENWITKNGGAALNDSEVERYIAVRPTQAQIAHSKRPFYCFVHFGMNTATGREWGNGAETADDFTISKIDTTQWARAIKASGATGIIFTCKHHDGFCMWNTGTTDFNVMRSPYGLDVVAMVASACREEGLDFGVYLSPWDMHEPTYGKAIYNDVFCRQLTELLTLYGDIFEVWFDGAKGEQAKDFEYDWERYYRLVRTLQPNANIAICGPDIRWVGNEAGAARENEYSVVPRYLTVAETVQKHSQQTASDAERLQKIKSSDEDLGSRKTLEKYDELVWYPAEVDVSIRKGWFASAENENTVKCSKKLFEMYMNSVGKNAFFLLNVPPTSKGVISRRETRTLRKLGEKIGAIYANPVRVENVGEMKDGYVEYKFSSETRINYCVIKEDIAYSQRVESFDLYIIKPNGKYKRVCKGGIIGSRRIIKIGANCIGAVLVVRQSRSTPYIEEIAFYG